MARPELAVRLARRVWVAGFSYNGSSAGGAGGGIDASNVAYAGGASGAANFLGPQRRHGRSCRRERRQWRPNRYQGATN